MRAAWGRGRWGKRPRPGSTRNASGTSRPDRPRAPRAERGRAPHRASFPWKAADGAFIVPAGHVVGGLLTFLGAGSGLSALSPRMAGDPRWRGLAAYALGSGLAILALSLIFNVLARSPDAPLYPWAGAVQRATVAVWFACTIVLALRLRRVAADSVDGNRPG